MDRGGRGGTRGSRGGGQGGKRARGRGAKGKGGKGGKGRRAQSGKGLREKWGKGIAEQHLPRPPIITSNPEAEVSGCLQRFECIFPGVSICFAPTTHP